MWPGTSKGKPEDMDLQALDLSEPWEGHPFLVRTSTSSALEEAEPLRPNKAPGALIRPRSALSSGCPAVIGR